MQALLVAFTVFVGILNPTQAGSNSTLGKAIGPILAGLTSMVLGTLSIVVLGLCIGGFTWPGTDKVVGAPWWAWVGGIMGAALITAQLFVAEKLGSAVFTGVLVTASLVTSVLLDHFGLVGFKQHTASWIRIGGLALMIAGIGVVSAS